MQLRIFTEPQQGADYQTLLRMAQATEELGFDAFFRSDHFLKMDHGGGPAGGLPGPTVTVLRHVAPGARVIVAKRSSNRPSTSTWTV